MRLKSEPCAQEKETKQRARISPSPFRSHTSPKSQSEGNWEGDPYSNLSLFTGETLALLREAGIIRSMPCVRDALSAFDTAQGAPQPNKGAGQTHAHARGRWEMSWMARSEPVPSHQGTVSLSSCSFKDQGIRGA